MDTSSRLNLPYLAAAQAQKHVTHNDALRLLDAVVQLSALSVADEPSGEAKDGDTYLVSRAPTGAFSGQAAAIAYNDAGSWIFAVPSEGWRCWVASSETLFVFANGAWGPFAPSAFDRLGVNAVADDVTRLAVATDSALLTHDATGDIRVNMNKADTSRTASLLFQNGYSGRCEIGLTGTDDLGFKVSSDGAQWHDIMTIASASRRVGVGTKQPRAALDVAGDLAATGFRSGTLSIASETATSIGLDEITGLLFVWAHSPNYPHPLLYGQFWFDCGLSLSIADIAKGVDIGSTTGTVDVEDAPVDTLTISADTARLTFVNRLGHSRNLRYLIMA